MQKLTALTEHLLSITGLSREQIYAFADKGQLLPTGKHLGHLRPEPNESGEILNQVEIGIWSYDAVIQIERYPGNGPALAAVVLGWLSDCDPERGDLGDPEMDISLNDENSADVEIALGFEERLVVVEDPNGDIPFLGKKWSMAKPEITPVEELENMRRGKI